MFQRRLLTSLILIALALLISVGGSLIPYGELAVVTLAFVVVGFSSFEYARLFCRDQTTERINVLRGAWLFILIFGAPLSLLPTAIAWVSGMEPKVISPSVFGMWACWFVLGSLYQSWLSRDKLEVGLGERLWPAYFLISICGSTMLLLGAMHGSYLTMWWLLATVIASDSAAYFVGKGVGGPKLAEGISPNKTISGSIAGLCGGAIAAVILKYLLGNTQLSLYSAALFGVAVSICAQLGDLAKSYLKRLRGVKDFGAIFPGHGGVLDRCDGMLAGSLAVLAGSLWL